jgi:hypothetical protein
MQKRRAYIMRLMLSGLTFAQIAELCCAALGITEHQVRYVYDEVNEEWARQSEQELRYARPQAIQRIRCDLAEMRTPRPLRDRDGKVVRDVVRGPDGKPLKKGRKLVRAVVEAEKDWKALSGHEMLLARIEGTLRPVELKIDPATTQRRALQSVISNLSPEDMDRMVAEQAELEAKSRGG